MAEKNAPGETTLFIQKMDGELLGWDRPALRLRGERQFLLYGEFDTSLEPALWRQFIYDPRLGRNRDAGLLGEETNVIRAIFGI